MFERVVSYDAFYVGKFPSFEDDIKIGLACAATQADSIGCGITVVAPSKQQFKDFRLLSRLPASVGRETPRTLKAYLSRSEQVVLACWPTAQDLDQLDSLTGLRALIVVPWDEDELGTWSVARGAKDLLGGRPTAPEPTIADPIVARAMKDLTVRVNLATGLHHPDDRSAAIQAFRILKRNKRRVEPEEFEFGPWRMGGTQRTLDN